MQLDLVFVFFSISTKVTPFFLILPLLPQLSSSCPLSSTNTKRKIRASVARAQMNGTNHFALFLSTPQIHLSTIWCHPWPSWTKHQGKSIIKSEWLLPFLFSFSITTALKKRFRETFKLNWIALYNLHLVLVAFLLIEKHLGYINIGTWRNSERLMTCVSSKKRLRALMTKWGWGVDRTRCNARPWKYIYLSLSEMALFL